MCEMYGISLASVNPVLFKAREAGKDYYVQVMGIFRHRCHLYLVLDLPAGLASVSGCQIMESCIVNGTSVILRFPFFVEKDEKEWIFRSYEGTDSELMKRYLQEIIEITRANRL